jgi:peptide/nickel transport system substrate-binding protein
VSIRPTRFAGVLLTLLIAGAAFFFYWRAVAPQPAAGGGEVRAERGGQIVATLRSAPRSFNRLVARDYASDVVNFLLQGRLLRINRSTLELEPWLAERWESTPDGLTHTFYLRPGLAWSDGTPFTSADVVFSLQAALDPGSGSGVAESLMAGGEPIRAAAPDAATVVFTYAAPSGPGVGLLDGLTILPKHKLEPALMNGTFKDAWGPDTAPEEIVGMGPFVLREYRAGERIVFDRNPRYWRTDASGVSLPYLDRVVFEFAPDQNTELLRLTSGAVDVTSSELRHDDYVTARRAEEEGTIELAELGVAPDADASGSASTRR